MSNIIKEAFEHSQFFENYRNIDDVLMRFKNINKKYKKAKQELKKDLVYFIHEFIQYNVKVEYLEKYIFFLFEKYNPHDIITEIIELKGGVYNNIYNINSIKIFLDDDLDETFIYENCTPEYFLLNKNLDRKKLEKNNKMTVFFDQLDIYKKKLDYNLKIGNNIKKYLKYSDDINKSFIGAVKSGSIDNIKYILKQGADIHYNYDSALIMSIKKDREDVFEFLVKKYGKMDENFIRYLLLSTYTDKNLKIIKLLIDKRTIDIEIINKSLVKYAEEGCLDIVQYLIQKGADINYQENINDLNPLEVSIYNNHYEIVKYLVKNGAIINDQNINALNIALYARKMKIIKFLIDNGAKIDEKLRDVFEHLIMRNKPKIIKLLIEKGFNTHYDDDKPLKLATLYKYDEIIKILI